MELNYFYSSLPLCVKSQLIKIRPIFDNNNIIMKKVLKVMQIYNINIDIAFAYIIIDMIDVKEVLRKELFDIVHCYDEKENEIKLKKAISKHKDVIVCDGFYSKLNIEIVIKYHSSKKGDITYEIECYRHLKKEGADVPWFYDKARCLQQPVLMMEKLLPLDKEDNPFNVAIDVMKTLKILHKFCIHNDIKPGNIMKKDKKYYLIDYHGSTSQRYKHGFIRRVWTRNYTSQDMHVHKQLTTPKNDFIELIYTMKSMENKSQGTPKKSHREGFSGKLLTVYEYVLTIDEKYVPDVVYDTIISLCS